MHIKIEFKSRSYETLFCRYSTNKLCDKLLVITHFKSLFMSNGSVYDALALLLISKYKFIVFTDKRLIND